jgi:hypothetical protein
MVGVHSERPLVEGDTSKIDDISPLTSIEEDIVLPTSRRQKSNRKGNRR